MKQRLLIAAVVLGPLAWLFGGALMRDEMFVFRDAAHYYYPLYHYVAGQWQAGRVPLWNPRENLGQPLLADATSAVVYPGKLIFVSPLGFDTNFKLYIVGHLLFAAITAFAAARGFGRSPYAAALAALAYALGGSVLFQYCNVVYLVGAAWLPLAALAIDRALRARSWRWAIALGAVLAMMTLGGDPQTAYHAGLAAVLYALILWRSEVTSPVIKFGPQRLLLLGVAALSLFVLAAVQILPSAEWTRRSTRAAWDQPRNIYEAAASLRIADLENIDRFGFLLGRTTPGQHEETYDFSVGPWHLASFVWPNLFGQVFPTNTRWIGALPAEGRTWTPSLYIGLLPLVLALSQFRLRCSATDDPRIRWLSWLALLALLASFGWYSLGWLAREIYFAACGAGAAEPPWGSPLGGLYWLLNSLLPGYAYFRYPAKWLVFVSLALSLLAAYGFDAATNNQDAPVRRQLSVGRNIIALAFIGVAVALEFSAVTSTLAQHTPPDRLFGPLDLGQAKAGILWSQLHTFLAIAALYLLVVPRADRPLFLAARQAGWQPALLLIVTAIDLAAAQAMMIATAPAANWRTQSTVATRIANDVQSRGDEARSPVRVGRSPNFLPSDWIKKPALERQLIGQAWDHDTLLPRYHLLTDFELTASSSALRSADVVEMQRAQRRNAQRMTFEQYRIASDNRRIAGERIPLAGVAATQLVRVDSLPRAWIVHRAQTLPPLVERHGEAIWRRSNEVLALAADRGFRELAVVETPAALSLADHHERSDRADESCEIIAYEPSSVALMVRLASPGIVVLADAYDANWKCTATDARTGQTHDVQVLRTNRILRGVELPVGEYRLDFRYRPTSVYVGAILSAIGWLAFGALTLRASGAKALSATPS